MNYRQYLVRKKRKRKELIEITRITSNDRIFLDGRELMKSVVSEIRKEHRGQPILF
jgi:hypothetical protein